MTGRRASRSIGTAGIVLVVVAVALMAIPSTTAPTPGATGRSTPAAISSPPTIVLSSSSGENSVYISVWGGNFTDGAEVNISIVNPLVPGTNIVTYFDEATVGTGPESPDGAGNWSVENYRIPNLALGDYSVIASDGTLTATAAYDVTSESFQSVTLTVWPSEAYAGQMIYVNGTGFYPDAPLSGIWMGDMTGNTSIGSTSPVGAGTFSVLVTVPMLASAIYQVFAEDFTYDYASASFTLETSGGLTPTLVLDPSDGPADASVRALGSGFLADSAITVTGTPNNAGASAICPGASSDSSGGFSCTFSLPTSPGASSDLITATDTESDSAMATFTITGPAFIGVSASKSTEGGTLRLSGKGFVPSVDVLVQLISNRGEHKDVCEVFSSDSGGVACQFGVPFEPLATSYVVSATDANGDLATTRFTITPTLALSTSSAQPGVIVTANGTGYTPGDGLSLNFAGELSLCTTLVESSGNFTCQFPVPLIGSLTELVEAIDGAGRMATERFSVAALPTSTLPAYLWALGVPNQLTGGTTTSWNLDKSVASGPDLSVNARSDSDPSGNGAPWVRFAAGNAGGYLVNSWTLDSSYAPVQINVTMPVNNSVFETALSSLYEDLGDLSFRLVTYYPGQILNEFPGSATTLIYDEVDGSHCVATNVNVYATDGSSPLMSVGLACAKETRSTEYGGVSAMPITPLTAFPGYLLSVPASAGGVTSALMINGVGSIGALPGFEVVNWTSDFLRQPFQPQGAESKNTYYGELNATVLTSTLNSLWVEVGQSPEGVHLVQMDEVLSSGTAVEQFSFRTDLFTTVSESGVQGQDPLVSISMFFGSESGQSMT